MFPFINVQGIYFLRLLLQFIRFLRFRRPQALQMRGRILKTAENVMACGMQWLQFISLVAKYVLHKKRKRKRLMKPHILVTLMRGYK